MGEMADYTLECIDDDWTFKYSGIVKRPMCRYCGKRNLRWGRIGDRWLLYDGKAPHRCPKQPLPLEILKKLAEQNIANSKKK